MYSFVDVLTRSYELDHDLWNSMVTHVQGIDVLLAPELLVEGANDLRDPSPILDYARHNYDVVVIYENFKGSNLQTNPIMAEMVVQPDAQRRQHFVVLLSHRLSTNDAMSAFVHSVDLVINIADLANFKPVIRRAVAQYRELYQSFNEML